MSAPSPHSVIIKAAAPGETRQGTQDAHESGDARGVRVQLSMAENETRLLQQRRDELQSLLGKGYCEQSDGLVVPIGDCEKLRLEMLERILHFGHMIARAEMRKENCQTKLFDLAKERAQRSGVILSSP
jgi:hypothetical protein